MTWTLRRLSLHSRQRGWAARAVRLTVPFGLLAACFAAPAAPPPLPPEVQRWIEALRAPASTVRANAARRLGRLGERTAGPRLVQALSDPEPAVRREAARALGRPRFQDATPALIRALRDPDVNVRFYAAWALGELCARKAVPALLAALKDSDWNVRNQAAWALRVIGDTPCLGPLGRMVDAPDADRKQILWVIEGFSPGQAAPVLVNVLEHTKSADLRVAIIRSLGKMGTDAARAAIERALDDKSALVRRAALEVLAQNLREALHDRFAALAQSDPDPAVRSAAERALKQLIVARGIGAWWSFDEKDPETVRDVTGLGNDGKVVKCTYAPGRVGAALVCRNGGYVECGFPPHLDMGGRPFSVTAWVYPESPTRVVVARGGAWCGFSLYILNGVPKFGIHRVQDGPSYIAAAAKPIPLRTWTHLTGVVHPKRIELYVNGTLAAAAKIPGMLLSNCGQGLEIGFDAGNSPAEITDHFTGLIDEVKFWTKALPPEKILDDMRAGATKAK